MMLKGSGSTGTDLMARTKLANDLMFLTRGQPVVYYGDEQGFIGAGGDKDARQDMFATKVGQYAGEELVGGTAGSKDRYDTKAPLYQQISALSKLRAGNPGLADGAQIHRYASDGAGIYAFSRVDAASVHGVPGRGQQRDHGPERDFRDLRQERGVRPDLWRWRPAEVRQGHAGDRQRAGPLGVGMEGAGPDRRANSCPGHLDHLTTAWRGRRGSGRDLCRVDRERFCRGHLRRAPGGDEQLAGPGDRRQRAVPRL